MDTTGKAKLINKFRNSLTLLSHRIRKVTARITIENPKGDSWIPCTRSHIKQPESFILCRGNCARKEERIKDMKNKSISGLGDAREVDTLVLLEDKLKMPHHQYGLLFRECNIVLTHDFKK